MTEAEMEADLTTLMEIFRARHGRAPETTAETVEWLSTVKHEADFANFWYEMLHVGLRGIFENAHGRAPQNDDEFLDWDRRGRRDVN